MPTLRERFAVDVSERDRAIEYLKAEGYPVLEAQDGGGEFGRVGEPWAVIVVESADDVEDGTRQTQYAFTTAVGDLLTHGGFKWRLVSRPNRYRAILTPSGWVRALQKRRP